MAEIEKKKMALEEDKEELANELQKKEDKLKIEQEEKNKLEEMIN